MIFERLSFEKLFGVRRKSETTIVVSGEQETGLPSRSRVSRWVKRPGDMFRDHNSLRTLELEVKHRNSLLNLDF